MKKSDEGTLFNEEQMSFEEALEKLEANVEKLEKGKLKLKEAMEVFKESILLSDTCLKELNDAEQILSKIRLDEDGQLIEEDWDPLGGEE